MRFYILCILMAVLVAGCTPVEQAELTDPATAVAAAVSTRLAGLPTWTRVPAAIPATPTETQMPSPTDSFAEQTKTPTPEYPYPYITWTPSQCDYSAFIADLDVVDYSRVYPGTSFTKTWRIKNIGTCTWTTQYRFQYISGTPMGADTIFLPHSVAPGETIDLSLQMTAPEVEEDFSNFWRLRNTAGEIFGTTFYVAIEVSKDAGKTTPIVEQEMVTSTP